MLAEVFWVSPKEAATVYTSVKKILDLSAEVSGESTSRISNIEKLTRAMAVLRGNTRNNFDLDTLQIGNRLDELFAEYPPFIDPDIIEACMRARSLGILVSIASNTNFIQGKIIQRCLPDIFHFSLYSDEIEVSKPHPWFFDQVKRGARLNGVKFPSEIVHIGDHPICDGLSTLSGIQFRLVENYNTAMVINKELDQL